MNLNDNIICINTMKEYENFISQIEFEKLEMNDIKKIVNVLVKVLPNNGKLYRFRKADKSNFKNTFDEINNGYIWLSNVNNFIDKTDCRFVFNHDVQSNKIKKILVNNQSIIFRLYLYFSFYKELLKHKKITYSIVDELTLCMNDEKGIFNKELALKIFSNYGFSKGTSNHLLDMLIEEYNFNIINNKNLLDNLGQSIIRGINDIRNNLYAASFTNNYTDSKMWQDYGGKEGVCIEYDFSKLAIRSKSPNEWGLCIFKIKYEDKKDVDVSNILYSLANDKNKYLDIYNETRLKIIEQQCTKEICFSSENEYRLLLQYPEEELTGYKFFAKLISKIIINEDLYLTDNGSRLVKMILKKDIEVYVRFYDTTLNIIRYLEVSEYDKDRSLIH